MQAGSSEQQIIKKEQGEIKEEPVEENSEVHPHRQEEEQAIEEKEVSGRRIKCEPEEP